MAHSKSALKRLRTSLVARARNRSIKSALRTQVRHVAELIGAGSSEAAPVLVKIGGSLDRAARKGVIHPNKAARLKSRLTKRLTTASAVVETKEPKTAKAAKPKTTRKKAK